MVIYNREVLVCLIFLPSLFSLVFLYSAISHISSLGKSRSKIKKEKQINNLLQKLLLVGYVESCKCHVITAKRLRIIYWLLIGAILLCSVFCIFSSCEIVSIILQYCVVAKVILLDIPINVYCVIMTKYAKHGGVTWRWEY